MINQVIAILVMGVIFYAGFFCWNVCSDEPALTGREKLATFVVGFIIFGGPFAELFSFELAANNSNVFSLWNELPPAFVAGFSMQPTLKMLRRK